VNDEPPTAALRLSLVEEIDFHHEEDSVTLSSARGEASYPHLSPGMVEAFRRVADGTCERAGLNGIVLERDDLGRLSQFNHLLDQWIGRCFVEFTLWSGERRLLGFRLTVPVPGFRLAELPAGAGCVLSRFAFGRSDDGALVFESPLSRSRLTVHEPGLASLVALLVHPRSLADVVEHGPFPDDVAEHALRLLLSSGVAVLCPSGSAAETDPPLVMWDFHDLLFHTRSRVGRHDRPVGATFRFAGSLPALPLEAAPPDGPSVPLPTTAARARNAEDAALGTLMDARRSVRDQGEDPLTLPQLGEFLFRVARLKATARQEVRDPAGTLVESFEIASKPYPSGGGLYELELYPVISRCRGIDPGVYHYDSRRHRLVRRAGEGAGLERILDDAANSAGTTSRPQVLVVVSARFGRLGWKYESIAYAAMLKNVGSLYQTMYLVATAMGLAPCALGSGNSELFARLAGLHYESETSVGEFMLGSLPSTTPEAPPYIIDLRPNPIG